MTLASLERLCMLIKCETKGIDAWWFLIRGEKKKNNSLLEERGYSEEQHLIVSTSVTFQYTLTFGKKKNNKTTKKEIYTCNKESKFECPIEGKRLWDHKHSFDYTQWNRVVYFIRTRNNLKHLTLPNPAATLIISLFKQ